MSREVFQAIAKDTLKGRAIHQLAAGNSGSKDSNVLALAADVVDRETITVGGQAYQLVVLNTAAGTSTALDNTAPTNVTETLTAHGLSVGAALRCENEFLKVVKVVDANTVQLARGQWGSTIASHADATAIVKQSAVALTAGTVMVPLGATLTPAGAGPQIATALNYHAPSGFAVSYETGEVIFTRAGADSGVAFSETLSGAGNAFDVATSSGGVAPGASLQATSLRVPNAAEVTRGVMRFYFDFDVTFARVIVRVTATQAAKAWDGATTVSGSGVALDNAGSVDWAVTDTVMVEVFGN